MIKTDSADYNAAHWDGERWEMVRVGSRNVGFDGVFAFNENEIWFSDGCFIYRYDGTLFNKLWECDWQSFGPGQANAIWGSSPEDVWFAGNGGSIVHYDGSGFTRLESGTEVDLHQIHGTANGEYIFFQGKHHQGYRTILLRYHQAVLTKLYECETLHPGENNYGYLYSSYLSGYTVISATKAGVWKYNYLTGQSVLIPDEVTDSGDRYIRRIVGNSECDFIFAGNWWDFIHFNGQNYYYDSQVLQLFGEGGSAVLGAAMQGDHAIFN